MNGNLFLYKGNWYHKSDRKPEKGELLLCYGAVGEFRYTDGVFNIVNYAGSFNGRDAWYAVDCKVLEPVESKKPTLSELCAKCTPENRHKEIFAEPTQASPEIIDMLANLARRVTQLESQLVATQRNLETFACQTEENSDDIRELDGRTQVLDAINKYYAEGSR
jgi:hypothetical protein